VKLAVEENIDCADTSLAREGSQLTPQSDKHESAIEPTKGVIIEEDGGCDDKTPDSCQLATYFSLVGLTPSSFASVASPNHLHHYYYFCVRLCYAVYY
jgi:hypothetical protein